ncbi:MAG: methylmalonyl-CoA mutase family protein, partial [Caulobacteraceae bacterium]
MDDQVLPLLARFPPATGKAWRALVEKTLGGGAPESLASRTADDLLIQPLYAEEDRAGRLLAAAGQGVGRRAAGRAWDVRAAIRHPDRATANSQILEALAGGASSVLIAIDPRGAEGVAVASADAFAALIEGVVVEAAAIALDAAFLGVRSAGWLAAAAKASPRTRLAFHLDPLGALAASGASPGPVAEHLAAGAAVAAKLSETYPQSTAF